MKKCVLGLTLVFLLVLTASADTFVVDNIGDPGDGICGSPGCTLREAITAANTNAGADIINFNIFGNSVHTISPTSALPTITEAVTIDGYTEPGSSENTLAVGNNAELLIEVSGASAGLLINGLNVATDDCVVRGLAINRFSSSGININGDNNLVEGNFVGTGPGGTIDLGNGFRGISITTGSNNTVGGPLPGARNLVSGNGSAGVVIFCCNATGNVIQGNYIGTNAAGTVALPNDEDGIYLGGTSIDNQIGGTAVGAGNLISGNMDHGILITDGGGGGIGGSNTIQGNLIGTNATGTAALGNHSLGILIENRSDNLIGGMAAGARNVISGNTDFGASGIEIEGLTATNNQVLGNYIGTDILGTSDLGNNQNGVLIINAPDNIIGSAAAGAGNVISGNPFGIQLVGLSTTGTQIQGNFIGTDVTGTLPIANGLGVYAFSSSSNTLIGGSGAAGNVIAFNDAYGVSVSGGTGNHIFGNSIFGNGLLGINLSGGDEDSNHVTANDVGDADVGSNDLQNYPAINEIATSGQTRTAEGQLNSAANTDYVIDFYENTEIDPSGFGEGESYLGSSDVRTSSLGEVFFSFPLPESAIGKFISATATDPNGNTSEFSMASGEVPGASQSLNISTRAEIFTGDNVMIGGFIITGSEPKRVLIRAIGPSLVNLGLSGVLADPLLELHMPDGSVMTNDNWRDTQEQEIIDTTIPPTNNSESAIVATLEPEAYTAIVRGVNNGTGIGLVEVFDLDQAADSQLANISTRGLVETSDDVMIGGFITGPGTNSTIVVRALGPSLTAMGVNGALQDPTLELHDESGTIIAANDNWMNGANHQAIMDNGLAPTEESESALIASLAPGAYTAIVRGVNSTSGVGLVEVYNLE